jgi:hypothetical protein
MSPLSSQQQGVIGQYEFAKLVVLGGKGQLEVDEPISDDERRDEEIHRKHRFRPSLAIQVKTSTVLGPSPRRLLDVRFNVPATHVFTDPAYWYFFAHLDLKTMAFSDPVFIVPSREVHEHARFGKAGAMLHFSFRASLAERSRDKWAPYRVAQREVGARVLEILAQLKAEQGLLRAPKQLEALPDVVWVGTKGSRRA